jgi:hypothetical protein
MPLDIWRHVLVMGIGAGQRWIIGMGKGVVPVQLLLVRIGSPAVLLAIWSTWPIEINQSMRHFVTVTFDHVQLEVEKLLNAEDDIASKKTRPSTRPNKEPDAMYTSVDRWIDG